VGPEDDVDVGGTRPERLPVSSCWRDILRLRREPSGRRCFQRAQRSEIAVYLLIGFFTDAAGVEEDEVRLLEGGGGEVIGR